MLFFFSFTLVFFWTWTKNVCFFSKREWRIFFSTWIKKKHFFFVMKKFWLFSIVDLNRLNESETKISNWLQTFFLEESKDLLNLFPTTYFWNLETVKKKTFEKESVLQYTKQNYGNKRCWSSLSHGIKRTVLFSNLFDEMTSFIFNCIFLHA
jgi:hypothetical protein